MQPFDSLTHHGQVRRLRQLAAHALGQYDLGGEARFTLLLHLANTTFRVTGPDGAQYALRVCQPDTRTVDELRSEALWLAALRRDTGLGVPEPVPTRDGDLLTTARADGVPQWRACLLFRWVEGRFLRRRLTPARLRQVGALTARLHAHAASFPLPPAFTRPCLDVEVMVSRWQSQADDSLLATVSLEDRALFYTAADRIRAAINGLGLSADRFGLIHADLHHGNYLFHDGEARVIDFDDCGFEHHVYDLATTLWALQTHRRLPALQDALLEGYSAVRPLPPGWDTHLQAFIAARYLIVTYYVVARAADNPHLRRLAPRYVQIASDYVRRYMDG